MTYDGKYVVDTNQGSMIAAPCQNSYVNLTTELLTTAVFSDTNHLSYIAGDYVYVLEGNTGTNGGWLVYKAPLSDPTNLVKTGNRANYQAATTHAAGTLLIVGNYVYIYGNASTEIWRASLDFPESWNLMSDTLPFAVGGSNACVVGSTIYIFGSGAEDGNGAKILTASTSTPTVFTDSGSVLPSECIKMTLAVTPTNLFLYGGSAGAIENGLIFQASIGAPLTWTNPGSLPDNTQSRTAFVSANYIYLIGGQGGGTPNDDIYKSSINDGVTFTLAYNTSRARSNTTVQEINGILYVYGGQTSVLVYEVSVADLDNAVVSPFTTATRSLPDARWGYASIGIGDTYYMYGGHNVSGLPTAGVIQSCSFHGATASSRGPAKFNTTTTALATPVGGWNCVRIDDTIWFFGGITSPGAFTTKVFSAPVSSPTTITEAAASGGPSIAHNKCFIHNGYIYVVGGDDYGNVIGNGVALAPITAPTQWKTSNSTLPTELSRYSLAVIGNYVYLFGGCTTISGGIPGASSSVVYRSLLTELNEGGSTNWISVTALATASADHVMVMSNNYLYLIGGTSTGYTSIDTIQACLISELAGGVSNFKSLDNFSPGATTIAGANALYSENDFYILGGRTSTTDGAVTSIHRTVNRAYLKTLGDVKESTEAVPAISLGSGNANAYNSFMQSGNWPWHVAKTT